MQNPFWRKFWMFTWWSHQILYHGWVFWFLYHIGLGAEISAFDIYFSLNLCLVFIQAYPVCKLYGHSLTGRWLGWSEINYQSIGFISSAYKLNICTSLYITESVKSSSPLCVLVGRHSSVEGPGVCTGPAPAMGFPRVAPRLFSAHHDPKTEKRTKKSSLHLLGTWTIKAASTGPWGSGWLLHTEVESW